MATLVELIQHYGLAFVFVNVLLLQAGLPVPAYPTLIITGALAATGGASVPALVGTAVVAALIADVGWFLAGRRFGSRVLRTICARVAVAGFLRAARPSRSSPAGARSSLAVAKFIPGFASVATSMAGVVGLPLWKFLALRRDRRSALVGRRDRAGLCVQQRDQRRAWRRSRPSAGSACG